MSPTERIDRALAARMRRVELVGPLRVIMKGDAARSFIIAQDVDDTVLHSRFLFMCQDGPQGREIHSHDWVDYVYSLVDGNHDIRRYTAALREAVAALAPHAEHYECEDCWYSCPKHTKGYCGYEDDTPVEQRQCNCGADGVSAALARIADILTGVNAD